MSSRIREAAPPWRGRRVVLGVTGGIAAYKAVQIARELTLAGAEVDVVTTRSAGEFVRDLTFEGVTGRRVCRELFEADGAALHIRLGREADLVVVTPATADFLARAAQGRADDLLTTTLLATSAPVLLCPAMNDRMWAHPQVQANARHCADQLSYTVLGPSSGALAAGEASGPGRMVEPESVVAWCGRLLGHSGALSGRRVLVTAGPTREPIDPVRYVGNRSSGRMGFALAEQAWLQGADVVLVSGPSALADPEGVEVIRVETAQQMLESVRAQIAQADLLLYAAAVSDYRPIQIAERKLKRSETGADLAVELTANPDIALETRELRRNDAVAVGFALETDDLLANAKTKLAAKSFDLIVANDARDPEAGFEVETNRVTFVHADGRTEPLEVMSKSAVAREVLDRAASLLASRRGGSGQAQ